MKIKNRTAVMKGFSLECFVNPGPGWKYTHNITSEKPNGERAVTAARDYWQDREWKPLSSRHLGHLRHQRTDVSSSRLTRGSSRLGKVRHQRGVLPGFPHLWQCVWAQAHFWWRYGSLFPPITVTFYFTIQTLSPPTILGLYLTILTIKKVSIPRHKLNCEV